MTRRPRRGKGRPLGRRRARQQRPVRPRFLIVCEGEQTEPNYFRRFRTNVVVEVIGIGQAPKGVVQQALRRARGEDFDQVWVVFDKDDIPLRPSTKPSRWRRPGG